MRLHAWLNRLGERSRPHYGQLVLYTILFSSFILCCYFVFWWGEMRTSDVRTTAPTSLLSFREISTSLGILAPGGTGFKVPICP